MMGLKGRVCPNIPMAKMTWLCVGGNADMVFYPHDEDDLSAFLQQYTGQIYIMGAGSNILVRDGGIRGTVIKLGKGFRSITFHTDTDVELGVGLLDSHVARHMQEIGLSGFEFLYTIPGTIGGGLAMNAGCYGSAYADRLLWARVMDPQGKIHRLSVDTLGYGYRSCGLPSGWIFLSGCFRGVHACPKSIEKTMISFALQREKTQPLHVKTGGSTFTNTPEYSAWQLVDDAGFRGYRMGGGQFSEKHCNFLVNLGNSMASDLESLAEMAREKIFQRTGIQLKWEIVRWGEKLSEN